MKKVLLFLLMVSANLFAQGTLSNKDFGRISGTIIDSASNKPIEYATIVVFRGSDSTYSTGITSNDKGRFLLDKVPFGKLKVKVSFMGYENKIVDKIILDEKNSLKDLGTIKLSQKALDLEGVEVTAQRSLIEFNIDKTVVNVDKTLPSAGGSALDVLRNTPSVNVDADGNISLRGNSNINILIDGKPSSMANSQMLEQLPAGSLDKIELVTNPSAKYDAEGTAGIINIVLKKNKEKNINGLISANVGTKDNYNGSLSLNYKSDKLNLFSNYDNRFIRREGNGSAQRENYLQSGNTFYDQTMAMRFNGAWHNFKGGFDYSFDDKNSLSSSILYNGGKRNFKGRIILNDMNADRSIKQITRTSNDGEVNGHSLDYTLNYKRLFEKPGNELTADFFVSSSGHEDALSRITGNLDSDMNPAGDPFNEQNTLTDNQNLYASFTSDYVLPFSETNKFEAGYKGTLRDRNLDYSVDNLIEGNWVNDLNLSNEFNYKEQIHAAYAMYTGKVEKFKYQLGLRSENTITNANQKTLNEIHKENYLDFFPTLNLSREIFKGDEMKISYSRRINRPMIFFINPFVRFIDPTFAQKGNPNLKPEYIDSYEFANSFFHKQSSLITTLFYRETKDNFTFLAELKDDGVTYATFQNLGKRISYGLEVNAGHQIFKWWNLNANYSYFNSEIKGEYSGADETSPLNSYTVRLSSSMNLWWGISFQFNGNYSSPTIEAQGRTDEFFYTDAAIRKDFLNKKLNVSLRISDALNSMKFKSRINGENFRIINEQNPNNQIVTLSLTYTINNFKRTRERRDDGGGREYENMQ